MTRKRTILIVAILIIIGAFIFFRNKKDSIDVKEIKVENIEVRKTVSASGVVTSLSESDLAFPSVGQLSTLSVAKGDTVIEGTFLASIYNYDSSQDSQAAKDNRDVVRKDLEIYEENFLTNINGVGGQDEYDLNIIRLKELLNKAEASYQSTLGTLTKTLIHAPFDGTIIDVFKERGEVVTAGAAVIKLADLDNLIFEINVDQEDYGFLVLDQKVEIILDSYPEQVFKGAVSSLPQYADEDTAEFEIKIAIESTDTAPILLGMKGDASIIVEQTAEIVNAITFDNVFFNGGDGPFVWINDDGVLAKQEIEIGLEGDLYTEIKTDLSGLDLVSPVEIVDVKAGAEVKIIDK